MRGNGGRIVIAATALSREERAAELRAIEAAVRSCAACPLYVGTANGVPGVGNFEAVVMFVGEGPGAEEDKQGKPFVGRSGQFLTSIIESLGIARKDVFITNIVKHRPPANRDPEPNEIAACSDYLNRQIALINPRIIVTLGRHSMGRWFPGASITRIHGKVQNIGYGRIALAMFHPAAALRNPEWKVAFEKDMSVLPGLIARAQRANEAAARGEALPAGVPHPGDAGYVSTAVRQSAGESVESVPDTVASAVASADSAAETIEKLEGPADGHHDGAEQLSLFG